VALDIKKEVAELQAMYKESNTAKTFNAIIYGSFGTGKTNLLRTCRLPVFIDSFDPGGTKTIRDAIDRGEIVADNRWELEDPKSPSTFVAWDKAYHERKRSGFFQNFGTYCLDSATTWSDAAMNVTLKKEGRAGGHPWQNDYSPTMAMIAAAIRDMVTLPCDVILICHEDVDKDEASGRMFVGPLFTGKTARMKIPLLFDEIYCAQTKETSGGVNYQLLTRNTGLYRARTRLGAGGKFAMYEDQDIKKLLAKAGYPTNDKPLFK
jgi:hypothetical protein